jgi:hypothetical protein
MLGDWWAEEVWVEASLWLWLWSQASLVAYVSRSSASFEVFENLELAFVFILEDLLVRPVGRNDSASWFVKDGWHLVGEEIPGGCLRGFLNGVFFYVEQVGVPDKFAGEAAKDNDLFLVDLRDATSLALWETDGLNVDEGPWLSRLVVVHLDRVAVLLSLMGDTAEHVDELASESATSVVVPTYVERRHVVPEIQINVVLLAPIVCLVSLDTGPGHDEELIFQAADRVPVATILELIARDAVKHWLARVDQFEALLEGWLVPVDVTTTDQEEAVRLSLAVLEVVLELVLNVDSPFHDGLVMHEEGVTHLGVSFQDEDLLQGLGHWERGWSFLHEQWLMLHRGLAHYILFFLSLHLFHADRDPDLVDVIERRWVWLALAAKRVLLEILEEPEASTFTAIEENFGVQQCSHDTIHWLHPLHLMADWTRKILLRFVIACQILLFSLREID